MLLRRGGELSSALRRPRQQDHLGDRGYFDNALLDNFFGQWLWLRNLERAMAGLPSERREIILLVSLEGMSYEAVAKLLGVAIGTVRSRLSRGRAALRQAMDRGIGPAPGGRAQDDRAAALTA